MARRSKRYSQTIQRNLLACYQRASTFDVAQGLVWYSNANQTAQWLAGSYHVSLESACGVLAALSPGNPWDKNITDAEEFIRAYVSGNRGRYLPKVGSYGRKNRVKAERILTGKFPLDVLGGDKVRAFYSNILCPDARGIVTIDRHAKCCAVGVKLADKATLVRPAEYRYLTRHFLRCSEIVGVLPTQFQAVVWVTWRRLNGVLDQMDLELAA